MRRPCLRPVKVQGVAGGDVVDFLAKPGRDFPGHPSPQPQPCLEAWEGCGGRFRISLPGRVEDAGGVECRHDHGSRLRGHVLFTESTALGPDLTAPAPRRGGIPGERGRKLEATGESATGGPTRGAGPLGLDGSGRGAGHWRGGASRIDTCQTRPDKTPRVGICAKPHTREVCMTTKPGCRFKE
jgi:hypothetical protein